MTKKKTFGQRMGKYLLEILIIIVGITISFALNEWNNGRNGYKAYQEHMENLKNDLAVDVKQMKSDRNSIKEIRTNIAYALRYDPANLDSIPKLSNAIDNITNYVEFLPNNNTFKMLSSTGGFTVFKNKELVREMIQLYQYDYAYIDMMGRQKNDVLHKHLMPLLYEEVYFEDALTYPVIRTDVKAFLTNKKFRNICIDYEGSCTSYDWSYKRALDRVERIHELIAKEKG